VTGRFEGHDPQRGHDTAGVPWAGRTLSGTGFDHDTGAADQALAAALTRRDDEEALVAAVAAARLLTPVVAVPGETQDVDGLAADASSDMASVTLTAADGTRALPVFSSTAALASWEPTARPVPVTAQRAALAAVQEGCQEMVLDPPAPGSRAGGEHPAYTLRSSMVWALAMARPWVPAHRDEHVARAVAAAVAREPDVVRHDLRPGPEGALQVVLGLRPGLDESRLRALVTRIGEGLAADGEVRARIDALGFALRPADEAG
jgi:hypothetical protein